MLYIHVNKFSVMSGRCPVFIGRTSIKELITCLAEGHNSDFAGDESRTSIPNTQVSMLFFFSYFTGTAECADVVPK